MKRKALYGRDRDDARQDHWSLAEQCWGKRQGKNMSEWGSLESQKQALKAMFALEIPTLTPQTGKHEKPSEVFTKECDMVLGCNSGNSGVSAVRGRVKLEAETPTRKLLQLSRKTRQHQHTCPHPKIMYSSASFISSFYFWGCKKKKSLSFCVTQNPSLIIEDDKILILPHAESGTERCLQL